MMSSKSPQTPRSRDGQRPLVSVVMCTYNRGELLSSALQSLVDLQCDGFDYEVIVVDNNSNDETPRILSAWKTRYPEKLNVVPETRQGVAYARNRGLSEARGEWVAYFDDDQTACTRWLQELMQFACERNAKFVGGSVHLVFPEGCERKLGRFGRSALLDTRHFDAPRRFDYRFTPVTANMLLHRSVFEDVGRFDPQFNARGDDTVLFLRATRQGYEAWYTPKAIVYHHVARERFDDAAILKMVHKEMDGQAILDRNRFGWLFPLMISARWFQGACGYIPRFLWGKLTGDRDALLEGRLRALFYFGTVKQGIAILAPKVIRERFLKPWVPYPYVVYDEPGEGEAGARSDSYSKVVE